MGMMKQVAIAKQFGAQYTLYSVMERLGVPLDPKRAQFQAYLERKYGRRKGAK